MALDARGERTRNAILHAAMTVIAREGVAAATQRAVAIVAGMSLASTTYHFGTRAEMLAATMEYAGALAGEEIAHLSGEIRSGRLEPVQACVDYIGRQRSRESITGVVVFELGVAAARLPRLRPANDRFVRALRDLFAPFTATGSGQGLAEALYGVLLVELARDAASPGLTDTITTLFAAYGVRASQETR